MNCELEIVNEYKIKAVVCKIQTTAFRSFYFVHSVQGITNGKTNTQIRKNNAIPVG